MSDIQYLLRQLRDTEGELVRTERLFAKNPSNDALELNMLGLQKRQKSLRSQFDELTNRQLIDVCEYRLLPELEDRYPIAAISATLATFQELVSILFTAYRTKTPKQRATIPAELSSLAELDFSYSFQGSVGIVLTVPNDRLMFIESELDQAINSAFKVTKVESATEIADLARQVGVAPIRKAYNWALAHARHGMNAEIKWMRGGEIRDRAIAYTEKMFMVAEIIRSVSDMTSEHVTVTGLLTGLNVTTRTFQLEPPDAGIIRGRFTKDFAVNPAIPVPSYQTARLIKTVVIQYAVEEEGVTWELAGLEGG